MDQKQPKNRKSFWILTTTALAALASFLLSLWGVMGSFAGVFGSVVLIALIPVAGDQIVDEMDKSASWFESIISIGFVGGCFFLVLFAILQRKLKP